MESGLSLEGIEFPNRILIVEDDPTVQLVLKRAFSKVAEVMVASDGKEGLACLQSFRPTFIISDLSLPEMDGLAMLKEMRRTFLGACVPILVLTASEEGSVLLDCFREGADDFMVKPFSTAELKIRVSSIYLRQQVARDMNPLTRLPGNLVIKREIGLRLTRPDAFSVAYFDLDHFKAFNDSRGFDAGDMAISKLADILRSFADFHPLGRVFVGHVGGDDFVLITSPDLIKPMAEIVFARWKEAICEFYTPEELAAGVVQLVDRRGETVTAPLLSISIGVVRSAREGLDDLRKIAQVSAEVKKVAKSMPGNSLFIDRRTKYP